MSARLGGASSACVSRSSRQVRGPATNAAPRLPAVAIASGFARILGSRFDLSGASSSAPPARREEPRSLLPRAINGQGGISLRRRGGRREPDGCAGRHGMRLGYRLCRRPRSIVSSPRSCSISSPSREGRRGEINRILCPYGVWINYGPSGPLKALWRFDEAESAASLENVPDLPSPRPRRIGHNLPGSEVGTCPLRSFQNHICYLDIGGASRDRVEKPG